MAVFPQIGSKAIITQLPYTTGLAYANVVRDVESGMRWTYPRRGVAAVPQTYSLNPLGKFEVQFSRVSDANLSTLEAFFVARKGRYGAFEFLDPGGNLLQYSEDFSDASWDKSNGPVVVNTTVADPFGQNNARALQSNGANGMLLSLIGPASGGLNGYVVNVSVWVSVRDSGKTSMHIGVVDSGWSAISGTTYTNLPYNGWRRIEHTAVLWNNSHYYLLIGGYGTFNNVINYFFGAQAVAMPGAGAYVKTPGNYGYHQYCRFDTDNFEVKVEGPNQNAVSLPIIEYNG